MIKESGPISFGQFFSICLTDPEFGYYMGKNKISTKGDFITSPEISQIFGEMIGVWQMSIWEQKN